MRNKIVGIIVVVFALVIGLVTWMFNLALTNIVETSCSHGLSCPMYGEIAFQTNISIGLMAAIILIGLYLIFFGQERFEVIKKVKVPVEVRRKPIDYSKLDKEERVLVKALENAEGTMFQSDLVENSGFDKVKVTRILDRLEGKQIIERKRRGMTNVVVLK